MNHADQIKLFLIISMELIVKDDKFTVMFRP